MNRFDTRKSSIVQALVPALAVVTFAVRLSCGPRTVDDAFITFRYARNLAEGAGFVFNPGEAILGTTTPLFALLMAAFHLVGAELPWSALLLTGLADAGTAVLIFLVLHRMSRNPMVALAAALLFSFSAGSIRFTAGGMETGLFVFLVMLSVWFFLEERYPAAAASAALATLTRPEGILVLGIVGGLYLLRFRELPWSMIGISLVICLPWVIFASIFFGSPIPNSVTAKGSTYAFPPLTSLKSMLDYLVAYVLPTNDLELGRSSKYGFAVVALLMSGLTAILYRKRGWSLNYAILWIFPAVYLGVYTIANPPVFEWYVLPLVPFAICLLALGGVYSWRSIVAWAKIVPALGLFQPLLLIAICVLGLLQVRQVLRTDPRGGRELVYADIAHKLEGSLAAGDSLATPEIGALGYLLPGSYILDTQGLVSPSAVPYRQQILATLPSDVDFQTLWYASATIPPGMIVEQRPKFVVSPDRLADRLALDEEFADAYRLILAEPSQFMGGKEILVWQRTDTPAR